jgi:hypothetical protein
MAQRHLIHPATRRNLEWAKELPPGVPKYHKTSAGRQRAWLNWGSKKFQLFAFTNQKGDNYQAVKVGQDLLVYKRFNAKTGRTRDYGRAWFWGFWKRDWRRDLRSGSK